MRQEFNIGDTVRRISGNNGLYGAKAGQLAEVVDKSDDFVYVKYGDVKSEGWYRKNTELVTPRLVPNKAEPYEFKVGDAGKLREGKTTYKVVAIVPYLKKPLIVQKYYSDGTPYPSVVQRYSDGRDMQDASTSVDLMPPSKIVFDVYYEYVEGWWTSGHVSSTLTYDNLEQAEKMYNDHINNTVNFKNVKLTPREVQPE